MSRRTEYSFVSTIRLCGYISWCELQASICCCAIYISFSFS